MATREDISLRRALTSVLPPTRIRRLARELGTVRRRRKVDIVALVYSLALGFSGGNQRSLAGLRRTYSRATGTTLAPSAFYDRFTAELARLLERLVHETLARRAKSSPRLRGVFARFSEVLATDSTILRLHDALEADFPSIFTNHMRASAKLNVVMNVVGRGAKRIQLTSGRTHDLRLLECGRWMRGKLLIFDLAYFQGHLFTKIGEQRGFFLSRLRQHTNPRIIASHQTRHRRFEGQMWKDVVPQLRGRTADFEVIMHYRTKIAGRYAHHYRRFRVVGAWNDDEARYHFYITNVDPERLEAHHISAVYAARWEVELFFRELKMHNRIEQFPTCKKHVSECLIYAALLAIALSRRFKSWLSTGRSALSERFTFDRWTILFATVAHDLLDVLFGPRSLRALLAKRLKRFLIHEARDPNIWRLSLPDRAQAGLLLPSSRAA